MDRSGRALQQLCSIAKTDSKINRTIGEWLKNTEANSTVDLYVQDQCVKDQHFNEEHKMAIIWLLTSYHATEICVRKFLKQRIRYTEWFVKNQNEAYEENSQAVPVELQSASIGKKSRSPFSSRDQESIGITALHVAVFRNSFHVAKVAQLLLDWDDSSNKNLNSDEKAKKCSLASIPMECGSCPLHILTGQNLTIKEKLLKTLLYADASVAFKDDINGDNPISLLWKNTLRFRWAISIMEGASFIDYIESDDCSWMTVITPHQYIKLTLMMAGAAQSRKKDEENAGHTGVKSIHDICRIPRCPPMLLRLLQSPKYNTLFPVSGNAYTFDDYGMLPIHHAVKSPPVTYKLIPSYMELHHQKSLVEILLEENPDGASIADERGRLPLHYALESGFLSERDIFTLIRLYPDSLGIKDPMTGLLPFMLVAMDQRRTTRNSSVSGTQDQKLSYAQCEKLKRAKDCNIHNAERYQAEWKKEHVRMSSMLLLMCPNAISFQNFSLK